MIVEIETDYTKKNDLYNIVMPLVKTKNIIWGFISLKSNGLLTIDINMPTLESLKPLSKTGKISIIETTNDINGVI